MEIKYALSILYSYSPPPSLLLFNEPPSKRRSDLYCSDSREPRGPHALGIQLSKNAKRTRLMIMGTSASIHRKHGNNRTCFFTKDTTTFLHRPPPFPHETVTLEIITWNPCHSYLGEVLEIEVLCSGTLASLCQALHSLLMVSQHEDPGF